MDNLKQRELELEAEAKRINAGRKPKFGDLMRNPWASDTNPHRDGYFVRQIGTGSHASFEFTNRKGKFWETSTKYAFFLDSPAQSDLAAAIMALPLPNDGAAWVTPLRYGSKVSFPKPPKPDAWDDDEEKWFCRPLFSEDQVRSLLTSAASVAASHVPAQEQAAISALEIDKIAANYFAEPWAQDKAKDAINEAITAALAKQVPAQEQGTASIDQQFLAVANDVRFACMKLYSPDDTATDWADKMAALKLVPIIRTARAAQLAQSADKAEG